MPYPASAIAYAGGVFGKKTDDMSGNPTVTQSPAEAAEAPKGRPTPTRKEAEANRKAALTGKAKPGASKQETKAVNREQMREARLKSREAMLRGDQDAMPARDKGQAKLYTRDFVDSRRTVAEFFVPVAVVVLLLGLMRDVNVQIFVTMVWFLVLVGSILDTAWWLYKLHAALRVKFPDKSERKGITFYAIMRGLQIRRLRLPPPRFRAGGRPVEPKSVKSK